MKRCGKFLIGIGVVVAVLFALFLVGFYAHSRDAAASEHDSPHSVDAIHENPKFSARGYAFTNKVISSESFPFVVSLEDHLLVGQSMRFDLKVADSTKNFSISFSNNDDSKVSMRLLFLGEQNALEIESCENGESLLNQSAVAKYAKNTEEPDTIVVHVRFSVGKFEIFVNFDNIVEFNPSLHLNTIENVLVNGDVDSCDVTYGGRLYPKDYRELFGQLKEGHVVITAQTSNNFSISFYDANLNRFFYMNSRFHQNTTVHNSHVEGDWGEEERHDDAFPFIEGELFELRMTVGNESVEVDFNRKKHFHFNHRTPHPLKDYVGIEAFGIDNLWNVEWY